jgi:hypothetical protein
MSLLVLALALALLAGGWVVHPLLFRRWRLIGDAIPAARLDRDARRRVALAALKDVEYDRAAGKLDDADYLEIRGRLEIEALEALRAAEQDAPPAAGIHACGFSNPAGSQFCAGCGQRLG